MKRMLLFLFVVFGMTFSHGQNDCSQSDGTFRYRALLLMENVPSDFDKNDFLDFIVGLDDISNEDLATLTDNISTVLKTLPSQNPHRLIDIVATTEIYSILEGLDNSIEHHYCVVMDCVNSEETYGYYALLAIGPIANDFDKDDFISYITGLDDVTTEDLAILVQHVTSVYKAFPSSQTDFLLRVVVIEATADIYLILEDLNNSVEFHECMFEDIILGTEFMEDNERSVVYPNPVTDDSVLELNPAAKRVRVEMINSLGQLLYQKIISGKTVITLKDLSVEKGISFLKIYDLDNGKVETFKVLK